MNAYKNANTKVHQLKSTPKDTTEEQITYSTHIGKVDTKLLDIINGTLKRAPII